MNAKSRTGHQVGSGSVVQGRNGQSIFIPKNSSSFPGRPHPFKLGVGEEGAKIYLGRFQHGISIITFETIEIEEQKVNSLLNQNFITPTETRIPSPMPGAEDDEGGGGGDEEETMWTELDWFGDVYLYWEFDPEDQSISKCEIKGPEEPETKDVPSLNRKLERNWGEGEQLGKYAVKIGSVSEEGEIEQLIKADFPWFPLFVQDDTGSESSGGGGGGSSSGSSGSNPEPPDPEESSDGSSDDGGACDGVEVTIGDPIVLAYGAHPCFDVPPVGTTMFATATFEVTVNQVGDEPLGHRCRSWWMYVYVTGGRPYNAAGFYGEMNQAFAYYLGFSGSGSTSAKFLLPIIAPCDKRKITVLITNAGATDILIPEDVAACEAAAECRTYGQLIVPPYCGSSCFSLSESDEEYG